MCLQRVRDYIFKYRENVVEEPLNIENVLSVVLSPKISRRGATLDFKSSANILDHVESNLLY